MRSAPKPVSSEDIPAKISRLSRLALGELKTAWEAEFRRAPAKGMWRDLLLRTLAWRIQEKAFGGHEKAAVKLLEAHEQKRRGDQRCKSLKAGTVLIRDFGGVRHTVEIRSEGFVWQEKTYSSLSAIAKIITGTNWNGPRFFGLREAQRKQDCARQETAA
jgi:hypothetical protein